MTVFLGDPLIRTVREISAVTPQQVPVFVAKMPGSRLNPVLQHQVKTKKLLVGLKSILVSSSKYCFSKPRPISPYAEALPLR